MAIYEELSPMTAAAARAYKNAAGAAKEIELILCSDGIHRTRAEAREFEGVNKPKPLVISD